MVEERERESQRNLVLCGWLHWQWRRAMNCIETQFCHLTLTPKV